MIAPASKCVCLLLVLIASSCAASIEEIQNESPPHIIFIMADDLGYGDLGSYGQKVIKTPHLDRLAQEGMRFTNVYSGAPVCAPSRSVLMTGTHAGHTTVRGNFGIGGVRGLGGGEGRVPLNAQDTTIAEVLKAAGYYTGMTGKWGLGEPGTSGEPLKQGFDEWFGYLNQRRAHSYYPDYVWKQNERFVLDGNANGGRETYSHDVFADYALDFIVRNKDRPFFLYIPFTIPHDAFEVPDLGVYESEEEWTDEEQAYAAMVSRMDRDIGRILDLLDAEGIAENTILFFCSDNGATRRWEGRFDSSGELRGYKRDMFEGGIRTPMIVRYPGVIAPSTVNHTPWYFADVLPTLAEIGGASIPSMVDGVSVWPTLKGEKQDLRERIMYWEFHERGFQQAVRWRNWKAIKPGADEPWRLYDVGTDVSEEHDVASANSDIVAYLAEKAGESRTESVSWPLDDGNSQ